MGSGSQELHKGYLAMYESLKQLRHQLDITCGESKVELLSHVTDIAERMMKLEEHTRKLHL